MPKIPEMECTSLGDWLWIKPVASPSTSTKRITMSITLELKLRNANDEELNKILHREWKRAGKHEKKS